MIFSTKTKTTTQAEPTVAFRSSIDVAIGTAIAAHADRRTLSNILETLAERLRVADAIGRPVL